MTPSRRIAIPPPDPERQRRATELAELCPKPARLGRVRFGTAGWTERTLIESKLFYPREAHTPELRLRHYAEHFSMVEVDATYYALIPPDVSARWVRWTPPDFRFDVKAFPLLTGHPIDVGRLPADLKAACRELGFERRVYPDRLPAEIAQEIAARFTRALAPLIDAGRLGAVLAQFPPWFARSAENLQKLEKLRRDYPDLPLAIEFRHASWLDADRLPSVLDLLRAERMSFVAVDSPSSAPLVAVPRTELAIVRFHGRNREGFSKRGALVQERFDYLYDPSELRAWIEPIRRLSDESVEVHAVFNNCVRNYAVLNAKDLAVLLTEPAAAENRRLE